MIVNNSNFIFADPKKLNPYSLEYREYWKETKRRVIEGYWSGGKWMPGNLYQYVNLWKIKIKKDKYSKTETIGRPFLRDLEWDKSYVLIEARGFSGFEKDLEFTCLREVDEYNRSTDETERDYIKHNLPNVVFRPDGSLKNYTNAREYLRSTTRDLGKPQFFNQAKNVIDFEARGSGKSYLAANNIAHNFLTDGATDYDMYLALKSTNEYMSSETLVGAIDSKYSSDLLSKVQLGLSELPGAIEYNGRFFPSPLSRGYKGTFKANDNIEAVRQVKMGNNWVTEGTRSKIQHRSFRDNYLAGNGTRPNLVYLEEVGFMGNLSMALGALKECVYNGNNKFGTIWAMGTGGENDPEIIQMIKQCYYEPEIYDCLTWHDPETNKAAGYFIPITKALNEFKDSEGITMEEPALASVMKERKKKEKSKAQLLIEITNRPLVRSEVFLAQTGNRFPIQDLKERLAALESKQLFKDAEYIGNIILDDLGNLIWKEDLKLRPIYNFPLTKEDNETGCIVIYEQPYTDDDGVIPYGRYLAGNDPYDQSKSVYTDSLGSTFIYDKLTGRIVAEYTGRPDNYKMYYENARRLLKYYNAVCLYENERKGFFDYMDYRNETHWLLDQPGCLRDVLQDGRTQRGKGCHMTIKIKEWGEELIYTWLTESAEDLNNPELKNLHKIRSIPLIKELIAYNKEGNYDRVMALMMVMIHIQEKKKIQKDTLHDTQYVLPHQQDFFNKPLYRHRGIL